MATINPPDKILQNLIAIGVILVVFWWVYKNMEDNRFKRWVGDFFDRMKEAISSGKK